jgi:hypothetical protein
MGGEVFAAIDVGSYEIALKIFELSMKNGVVSLIMSDTEWILEVRPMLPVGSQVIMWMR